MPNINTRFYGNNFKSFYGKVINVNDPLQLGRVQVRIFGIHTENEVDIPTKALPWASVVIPTTEGGVSGIGLNSGLKPFSTVYGIFADGHNAQEPLILGSVPSYQRDPVMRDTKFDFGIGTHDFVAPPTKPTNVDDFLIGSTNLEKSWNWFRSKLGGEYSKVSTAGILGNLWIESAGNQNGDLEPTQEQIGGGPGYGLAQWEIGSERYNELETRDSGYPIQTMFVQLRFISYELDKYPYFGKARLVQARTPEEASDIFMVLYERPKNYNGPIPKPRSLGGTGPDDYIPLKYSSAIERRETSRDIFNNFTS